MYFAQAYSEPQLLMYILSRAVQCRIILSGHHLSLKPLKKDLRCFTSIPSNLHISVRRILFAWLVITSNLPPILTRAALCTLGAHPFQSPRTPCLLTIFEKACEVLSTLSVCRKKLIQLDIKGSDGYK